MNYIIYEVRNKVNGKTYIGKHQTNDIYDDYLGSGVYLKNAINKYGRDCFEKVILYVFDNKKEMDDKEAEIVNENFIKNKDIYNLKLGGEGGWDHMNDKSSNHIQRCIDAGKKGYQTTLKKFGKEKWSEICRENLLKWQKSDDPEVKKKRSENSSKSFKGKKHTNETKSKIGKANSIHQKGSGNSNYGRCWVHNNDLQKSMCVPKDDIPNMLMDGWIKGRKMKF